VKVYELLDSLELKNWQLQVIILLYLAIIFIIHSSLGCAPLHFNKIANSCEDFVQARKQYYVIFFFFFLISQKNLYQKAQV
jgi:hypothetical protein